MRDAPFSWLENYEMIASPFFEQIGNVERQTKKLMELRDCLLPMPMNGQVSVGKEPVES